jgi:hypothetical protein
MRSIPTTFPLYGRVISERNLHILYVCYCMSDRNEITNRHFIWPSDVKAGLDVFLVQSCPSLLIVRGRRGRDPMVVGFTATYITSTYHH